MNWVSGVVLYIMIWLISLFAVLPIGTHPAEGADAATGWRGAPQAARMGWKAMITTIVTTILWLAIYLVITFDLLSFRHGILAG